MTLAARGAVGLESRDDPQGAGEGRYVLKQGDFGPLFFLLSNAFRAKPDVSLWHDPAGYMSLLYRFVKGSRRKTAHP